MTTEELLTELETGSPEGIVALSFPDSVERRYIWWGDRTLSLGLTARLAHFIHRELEEWEREETETGLTQGAEIRAMGEGHPG